MGKTIPCQDDAWNPINELVVVHFHYDFRECTCPWIGLREKHGTSLEETLVFTPKKSDNYGINRCYHVNVHESSMSFYIDGYHAYGMITHWHHWEHRHVTDWVLDDKARRVSKTQDSSMRGATQGSSGKQPASRGGPRDAWGDLWSSLLYYRGENGGWPAWKEIQMICFTVLHVTKVETWRGSMSAWSLSSVLGCSCCLSKRTESNCTSSQHGGGSKTRTPWFNHPKNVTGYISPYNMRWTRGPYQQFHRPWSSGRRNADMFFAPESVRLALQVSHSSSTSPTNPRVSRQRSTVLIPMLRCAVPRVDTRLSADRRPAKSG